MKERLTRIAAMATLLVFGLGLTGCMATKSDGMMHDSMAPQTQSIEKGTMNGTMSGSMETMKEEGKQEAMPAPMENMDQGGMESDMSGSMK